MIKRIEIDSFARLNFGLIDLSANPYRIDGSHGLYTNLPLAKVTLILNKNNKENIIYSNNKIEIKRYKAVYENCIKFLPINKRNVRVLIDHHLNACHIGLGSGTQISMSIVEAFNKVFNLNLSLEEKAYLAKSGGTSGVGVFCFDHGGYNLDAGRLFPVEKNLVGPSELFNPKTLAPLIGHFTFPNWYICLAIPKCNIRIYDKKEVNLFKKYTPISELDVNLICKWILKGIFPALVTNDFASFCFSISNCMKLGFRKKEIDTYGTIIIQCMKVLQENGFHGIGMSSFGPTLFGFSNNRNEAYNGYIELKENINFDSVYLTTARNIGANIIEFD